MKELQLRAFEAEFSNEGREFTALAVPYDVPSPVYDNQLKRRITEQISPTAFDVSLRQKGNTRPIFAIHDHRSITIGAAEFRSSPSEGGLIAEGKLGTRGKAAEVSEQMELGAMNSVSVGFHAIKTTQRDGIHVRTEAGLVEVSVVPTGFGAHPDAQVLELREDISDESMQRLANARVLLLSMPILVLS